MTRCGCADVTPRAATRGRVSPSRRSVLHCCARSIWRRPRRRSAWLAPPSTPWPEARGRAIARAGEGAGLPPRTPTKRLRLLELRQGQRPLEPVNGFVLRGWPTRTLIGRGWPSPENKPQLIDRKGPRPLLGGPGLGREERTNKPPGGSRAELCPSTGSSDCPEQPIPWSDSVAGCRALLPGWRHGGNGQISGGLLGIRDRDVG